MTINLTALQKQRYDTAANWTGANPTLLAGEIGIESDTLRWKVGNGSTAWTSLGYIPGLAYGTARQLLQTNSGATAAEWTSNVDIPGTLDVTGTSTLDGMVLMGTTTSIGGGKLQLSSDTTTTIQNFSFNATADSSTAMLQFIRGRGTKASPSVVLNGDYLGEIRFLGYGTTYNTGASIRAIVDGDPATAGDTSDMPTKLVFLTSPNGSSTPDTRMTIDSAGLVTIPGDLTVNGTTTTINSTTLVVQDKNIEMGVVATPTDVTADGGGITLKGTTDKTINWIDATDAWTLSEHVNIASAKEYRIAGTKVLDATSLGSAVVSSSLTSVGTIGTGVWQGTAIADTYLGTISTALKVSNSATTATSSNTASAIVARDASGNFTAGTITASLTGTASGNLVSGGALGTPSSGTLTNCTFPTLNQNTTGNAATVTTNANLTGDVTSVGNATSIAAGVIVDADINASAAIVDTKLATIATAGKVSNSATTATDANTASAIVARDASGNFTAGTITAALTGAASSNVLKAGDTMTGVLAVTAGTAALPAITPSGDPNTGIYSPGADQLAISTNGVQRLSIGSTGNIDIDSNTVFVDAVNNRVGVGTASPSEMFTLNNGNILINGNTADRIHFSGDGTKFLSNTGDASTSILALRGRAGLIFNTGGDTTYNGGTERLRITSTGALNFVGAGTAGSTQAVSFNGSAPVNSMVLTSGGLLGIGTSAPAQLLHVKSSSAYGVIVADNNGATGGGLFSSYQNGAQKAAFGVSGSIEGNTTSDLGLFADSTGGAIRFYTNGSPVTKAILDSTGRLGIGTNSATELLSVNGNLWLGNGGGSGGSEMLRIWNDSGVERIHGSNNPSALAFGMGGSSSAFEAFRIDSSRRLLVGTSTATANGGVIQTSNGITFPATQSECTNANTLDDYEEGTFSPTAFGGTTAGTTTYSLQFGMYVKVGQLCHYQVRLSVTNMTGTGDLLLGGLPFTAINDAERGYGNVTINYLDSLPFGNVADTFLACYINANSTNIIVRSSGNNRNSTSVPVDTAFTILYGGTYRTNT